LRTLDWNSAHKILDGRLLPNGSSSPAAGERDAGAQKGQP
jgi:hypothetical protein